jgi:hypothetical protein
MLGETAVALDDQEAGVTYEGMALERGEAASWAITKAAATGAICLRFVGPTRTSEIPDFLSALSEMMPPDDAHIVFDLRRLIGHNPETKEPIKAWLRQNKPRIRQVTVVVPSASAIHKMVTAVISLATGVKILIRETLEESTSVASA